MFLVFSLFVLTRINGYLLVSENSLFNKFSTKFNHAEGVHIPDFFLALFVVFFLIPCQAFTDFDDF